MKLRLCLITLMIAAMLQGCDDTFTAHAPLITDSDCVGNDSITGRYQLLFRNTSTGLYEGMPGLRIEIEITKDSKAYAGIMSAVTDKRTERTNYSLRLYPLTSKDNYILQSTMDYKPEDSAFQYPSYNFLAARQSPEGLHLFFCVPPDLSRHFDADSRYKNYERLANRHNLVVASIDRYHLLQRGDLDQLRKFFDDALVVPNLCQENMRLKKIP